MLLLWSVAYGILNRIRGSDFKTKSIVANKVLNILSTKYLCAVYAGILAFFWFNSYIFALAAGVSFAIWSLLGWGKYFMAFHGRDHYAENESFTADTIADFLYGRPVKDTERRNWATIAMSVVGLRWVVLPCIALIPIVILFPLPFEFAVYAALPVAFALLQGPIYGIMRYVPEKYAVPTAEILTGMIVITGVIGSVGYGFTQYIQQ